MTYDRSAPCPSHPPMNPTLATWISAVFSVASGRIDALESPKNSFSDIFCAFFGPGVTLVSWKIHNPGGHHVLAAHPWLLSRVFLWIS
jgi:hypothetical protein